MVIKEKEFENILNEVMKIEQFRELEKYEHHRITNRLNHSIAVAYKSYRLGKKLNFTQEELRNIAIGGLLHDFFLYDTRDGKHEHHLSNHPKVALENSMKYFKLNEREIDIILSHMFLVSFKKVPRYKESVIVSLMDKVVSVNEVYLRVRRKEKIISIV